MTDWGYSAPSVYRSVRGSRNVGIVRRHVVIAMRGLLAM
jgi:hypothetical protein